MFPGFLLYRLPRPKMTSKDCGISCLTCIVSMAQAVLTQLLDIADSIVCKLENVKATIV